MTIRHEDAFNRSPAAGFDGVFDWDFLFPAFAGTRIEPMDWDAVVERYGRFLVFETKEGGAIIKDGQKWTLENAIATGDPGRYTVIVLRAKKAADVDGWDSWVKQRDGLIHKTHHVGNDVALVSYCRKWFRWASQRKHKEAIDAARRKAGL